MTATALEPHVRAGETATPTEGLRCLFHHRSHTLREHSSQPNTRDKIFSREGGQQSTTYVTNSHSRVLSGPVSFGHLPLVQATFASGSFSSPLAQILTITSSDCVLYFLHFFGRAQFFLLRVLGLACLPLNYLFSFCTRGDKQNSESNQTVKGLSHCSVRNRNTILVPQAGRWCRNYLIFTRHYLFLTKIAPVIEHLSSAARLYIQQFNIYSK